MKKITIKDVAREAGVSVTLVSFVMNAKRGKDGRLDCPVNPETADRVLKVAKELGYRRNAAAASLRSGRSNTVAVITTDISNKYFAGISRHIEDRCHQYGYTVLFGSSDEKPEKLDNIMDTVLAYNIDGVIVAPVPGGEDAIRKAVDQNVPVVLLDRDIESFTEVGKVLLDDVAAGRMATDLLLSKGFRKIEMISYTLGISSLKEREEGYRESMTKAGLTQDISAHYIPYGAARETITTLIKDAVKRGVEALFLPTYTISASVLAAIRDLKLDIPKDLAIVAFDESDVYNLYTTTVAHIVQPLRSLGVHAVDLLHNMIENKPCDTKIVLKPELIPGGSVEK